MWKNSLIATTLVLFGVVLGLLGQVDYLAPYKATMFHRYAWQIGIYADLLAVNLYAAFFLLTRKLYLRDTGTKLVHLEKQLRNGSIPHELSQQLSREN